MGIGKTESGGVSVFTLLLFCRELMKSTRFITLAFVDPELEKAYYQHTESFSSVTLQAFLIVRLAIGVSQFIVLPR